MPEVKGQRMKKKLLCANFFAEKLSQGELSAEETSLFGAVFISFLCTGMLWLNRSKSILIQSC